MHYSLVVTALAALALPASAQTVQPRWIGDPTTGCRVWNSAPEPGDSISWSGDCRDGLAQGRGTLQWFKDGKPASRFDGQFRDGVLDGRGVYTFANGARYEGEYVEDLRHGWGVLTETDGSRYEGEWRHGLPNGSGSFRDVTGAVVSGTWTKGCLREGDRVATVLTTRRACGFE